MKNNNLIIACYIFILFLSINFNESIAENSIYNLQGSKLIYKNNNSLIIAEGNALAKDSSGKEIQAEKIIYNKKESTITTESKSIFKDAHGNKLYADIFFYNLKLKIIEAKNNVKYLDKEGNLFNFTKLKYYETEEKGFGENLVAQLKDKSFIESNKAEFDNKSKILIFGENNKLNIFERLANIFANKKNNYTPCKIKLDKAKSLEEICPEWSVSSETNIHDKNAKMVYHYNTTIKIKNIPVFYTPYFSHPDPTVKRKSGFLPPTFKNISDLGQTIRIPYFFEISPKNDFTFTPIYYFKENPIFLGEYRQQNNNSRFYIDASFNQGYKNLNKVDSNGAEIRRSAGNKNHFFFNFLGSYNNLLLDKNDLEINIQKISQKNYLNVNQITTKHVNQDIVSLNNNIILNAYKDNKKLNIRTNIYENLNTEVSNLKYQYTLPSIDYSNHFKNKEYYFNLSNSFSATNYGGDSNQVYFNNKIDINTEPKQFKMFENLSNIFKGSINNINANNSNMTNQKENLNSDLFLTAAIESSYPLIKIEKLNEQTLVPKVFIKHTSGSMTNANSDNKILSYDDIYSMNRMNSATNPETGVSLGYGLEFNNIDKNENNQINQKGELLIGQVIKPNRINEMPNSSTLQETRSSFVGSANFFKTNSNNLTKNNYFYKFDTQYDYIISNNLNKLLKSSLKTNIEISRNTLSAQYYETHDISNEHYVEIKYLKKFDNDVNFSFGGRKNIQDKFTEKNFIELNYDSDCLKIALNLSKIFYQNEELRPSKNLSLSLVLKPFGEVSPNLSGFLN